MFQRGRCHAPAPLALGGRLALGRCVARILLKSYQAARCCTEVVRKGFAMGRLALVFMAVVLWIGFAWNGYTVPDGLTDKMWLVALFPAVYILGVGLLGD